MDILVIQHIACETPGIFEGLLRERGAMVHRVEIDEGQAIGDWRSYDGIVAMGGPMSVNDEGTLQWLATEKRFIEDAVRAGVPYFGMCLGAQLLAAALGATVYRCSEPEVGLLPVTLTDAAGTDRLFRALRRDLMTFQWHSDTFDLPVGGELLASSGLCQNQAFRWGDGAYGLQFHLEVSAEMLSEWAGIPEYVDALEQAVGPGAVHTVIDEFDRHASQLHASGRGVFEPWLDLVSAARTKAKHALRA